MLDSNGLKLDARLLSVFEWTSGETNACVLEIVVEETLVFLRLEYFEWYWLVVSLSNEPVVRAESIRSLLRGDGAADESFDSLMVFIESFVDSTMR